MSTFRKDATFVQFVTEIKQTGPDLVRLYYSIRINPDTGNVFDEVEEKEFSSIEDWAEFFLQEEDDDFGETFIKTGSKYYFDDEY